MYSFRVSSTQMLISAHSSVSFTEVQLSFNFEICWFKVLKIWNWIKGCFSRFGTETFLCFRVHATGCCLHSGQFGPSGNVRAERYTQKIALPQMATRGLRSIRVSQSPQRELHVNRRNKNKHQMCAQWLQKKNKDGGRSAPLADRHTRTGQVHLLCNN